MIEYAKRTGEWILWFVKGLAVLVKLLLLGILKMLGIMAMQAGLMLLISLPFIIIFLIGALITGTGLHVAIMGVPIGMLVMMFLVVAGIDNM
jgi:hypothetical protein